MDAEESLECVSLFIQHAAACVARPEVVTCQILVTSDLTLVSSRNSINASNDFAKYFLTCNQVFCLAHLRLQVLMLWLAIWEGCNTSSNEKMRTKKCKKIKICTLVQIISRTFMNWLSGRNLTIYLIRIQTEDSSLQRTKSTRVWKNKYAPNHSIRSFEWFHKTTGFSYIPSLSIAVIWY